MLRMFRRLFWGYNIEFAVGLIGMVSLESTGVYSRVWKGLEPHFEADRVILPVI